MTTKHSFLPPSGALAWSKCALWPTMNERYPDANTAESEEGTAAHWVMAKTLAGEDVAEDSLAPNGQAVTGEMIDGAELILESMARLWSAASLVGDWHIEETVSIPAIHPDCFGTPDIWAYDEAARHLYIIDYKFGHRFVDEYWNPQGLLYMAGIIGQVPSIPETLSFTIVQPRCFYRGDPVRTHTYKIADATPHLVKLREAAERATHPTPTAITGPHCEHCPGRHACPTLQRAAYSDAETSTDQQPVELSPQSAALELRMLERALARLTARVDGLREQTLAALKSGKHVPHYKLESGRGRAAWTITPEEVIKLGKKHKKPLSLPKVLTPGQAKKLFVDESIISGYTTIIPGAVKLVESTDSEANRVFKKETHVKG